MSDTHQFRDDWLKRRPTLDELAASLASESERADRLAAALERMAAEPCEWHLREITGENYHDPAECYPCRARAALTDYQT